MKLAHPELDTVISIDAAPGKVAALVIENRRFFRELLSDIAGQIDGHDGKSVLSENDVPLAFHRCAELICDMIGFSINRKSLLSKVLDALEKDAMGEDHYLESMELLQRVEQYVFTLTKDFTADIVCGKLNMNAILKGVGISVNDEYDDPLERFLDYMELVREFVGEKLFVFVNLRSFFTKEELVPFLETAVAHEYRLLLIDASAADVLPMENRLTIDADLCEF